MSQKNHARLVANLVDIELRSNTDDMANYISAKNFGLTRLNIFSLGRSYGTRAFCHRVQTDLEPTHSHVQ
jgi:hypothetical protein